MQEFATEMETAVRWVEDNRAFLSEFHQQIWNYAEPAFREYKSARAYVDLLREQGFSVEEATGGMPTAFLATFGSGGPVLGTFVEYDAVPGNSQAPVPYRQPRAGTGQWAAGHTDPHSSLGVAALAGALAAKHSMEKHGLSGTLKIFGEPAEKVCGSKPVHAVKGYYEGFDAFLHYHPTWSPKGNTLAGETVSGSYWSAVFSFESEQPERWVSQDLMTIPGNPHATSRSPGALDAVCLMYTTTKYTKEAMFPHTGLWTLNEFMMVGGQATSDNLPPGLGQIQYSWRSPDLGIQEQIFRVLHNNAQHVAGVTNCKLRVRWVSKVRPGVPNMKLTELVYRNLERIGPPRFSEAAKETAREIQRNCGLDPMAEPLHETCEQIIPVEVTDANTRKALPPWQTHFSSDDAMEYTWYAPTTKLMTSRPYLKPPQEGYAYPAWVFNATGGIPSLIDPSIMVAGKVLGMSFVELLLDSQALEACQEEFRERTGGGIGGENWIPPLLPEDFSAPVELRWPEYVRTPRGEDWWIPAGGE